MTTITSELGSFEGKPVTRTTIALTNAGDGLSESLKIDPRLLHMDDKLYVVIECDVTKVRFDPAKDDGDQLTRVHVLKASTAVIVDPELVKDMVEAQREKNLRAKEAAQGIKRLPGMGDLAGEHESGLHDDPVPGCPGCEDEVTSGVPTERATKPAKKAGKSRKAPAATPPEDGPAETPVEGKAKKARPSRAEQRERKAARAGGLSVVPDQDDAPEAGPEDEAWGA